jgi:threonine dehydratase
VKRLQIESLGARIVDTGQDLAAAETEARRYVRGKQNFYYIHDPTDPVLPLGPATIACEILEQLPQTDSIVVPVGDTALIRGIAAALRHLKPETLVIGVQAEAAAAYYFSWKAGYAVPKHQYETVADGLATSTPVAENVRQIKETVDEFCLVSDREMLNAMRVLLAEEGITSEPAGAAATVALVSGKLVRTGRLLVLLVTGGNPSPEVPKQVKDELGSHR